MARKLTLFLKMVRDSFSPHSKLTVCMCVDDDGMWALAAAHLDNKASNAKTRYRAITKLTPAQQEKKSLRILQKS